MVKQIQLKDELIRVLDKVRRKKRCSYSEAMETLIKPKGVSKVSDEEIIECIEDDEGNLIPIDEIEEEEEEEED